jgi:hypothetical protein
MCNTFKTLVSDLFHPERKSDRKEGGPDSERRILSDGRNDEL